MRLALLTTAMLCAALAPVCLAAQEPQSAVLRIVVDQQLLYNAAKAKYQADSAAVESIQYQWDQLIAQLGLARQRGEDDEVGRLRGELEQLTGEKERLQRQHDESRQDWIDKGDWLIDALNDYLGLLDQQTGGSRAGSDDEAIDLYNRYEGLLEEVENELPPDDHEWEPMPEVTFHAGDSRRDTEHKLALIEKRVEEFTEVLADVDRDLDALEKRQERDQRKRDRQASRDRFDDNATATGGDRTNVTGDTGVTDSTAVRLSLRPLADRIAKLRAYREQVVAYLEGLKTKFAENSSKGNER